MKITIMHRRRHEKIYGWSKLKSLATFRLMNKGTNKQISLVKII